MDQTHDPTPPTPQHDPMPAVRLEEILALWSIRHIVLSNARIEMARKHIAELVAEIKRMHGTAGCELCGAACCPNCSFCHGCRGFLCPKCNEEPTHVCPQKALGAASAQAQEQPPCDVKSVAALDDIAWLKRSDVLKAIADEPEYPDACPPMLMGYIRQAMQDKDEDAFLHMMRESVRLTKDCITERVDALQSTAKPDFIREGGRS